MARRITYSDLCTGAEEKRLRKLLGESDTNSDKMSLYRKMMLNIIKNELTARQKEIIMLYYFREMNIVEISQRLDVSPQAVSAVLKRARLKLFRFMQYYVNKEAGYEYACCRLSEEIQQVGDAPLSHAGA